MKNTDLKSSELAQTPLTVSEAVYAHRDSMNARFGERQYEVNTLPSETIPDQTLSIRELLVRYANGLPLGGFIEGYYADDEESEKDDFEDLPDVRTLDLAEREELRERYLHELDEIKERLKEQYEKKVSVPPAGTPVSPEQGVSPK